MELREQIDSAMAALAAQGKTDLGLWVAHWPRAGEQFCEAEFRHESQIAQAAEAWCRGAPLPALPESARLLLHLRLEFGRRAAVVCGMADPGDSSAVLGSRESARRWALFQAWENAGFDTIHETIECLHAAWQPDTRRASKS